MGWQDVVNIGKKVKNSVVENAKYCTSVLNDFGFVQKALFQIYNVKDARPTISTNKELSLQTMFKYDTQFPVQINPTDIDFKYGSKSRKKVRHKVEKTKSMGGIDLIDTTPEYDFDDAQILLTYNIYDEYNARTSNGAVSIGEDISLHSGNHTSLSKLREYAGKQNCFTLFRWGDIHIFGFLSEVDISYKVYSPWGQPLVGTATVTIERQPLQFDNHGREIDPCDCPQIKLTEGAAEAEAHDYAAKAMRRMYQGINAMR